MSFLITIEINNVIYIILYLINKNTRNFDFNNKNYVFKPFFLSNINFFSFFKIFYLKKKFLFVTYKR